eukprot:6986806-Prymnesium_polylepis.1
MFVASKIAFGRSRVAFSWFAGIGGRMRTVLRQSRGQNSGPLRLGLKRTLKKRSETPPPPHLRHTMQRSGERRNEELNSDEHARSRNAAAVERKDLNWEWAGSMDRA